MDIRKWNIFLLFLTLCCLCSEMLNAKQKIAYPKELTSFEICNDTSELSFKQIQQLPPTSFKSYNGEKLFRNKTYWCRFKINKLQATRHNYYIHFNSLISYLWLYHPTDTGSYITYKGGSLVPEKERSTIGFRKDKLPFHIIHNPDKFYYIKIRTTFELSFNLNNIEVLPAKKFETIIFNDYLFQFFFFGMAAIILILNITLFLLTKDRLNLYYSLYLFFTTVYFLCFYQILERFLFNNHPRIDLELSRSLSFIPLIYVFFFIKILIKKKEIHYNKLLKTYVIGISIICFLLIIISIFDYYLYMEINDYYLIGNGIFIITLFFMFFRKVSTSIKIILTGSLFMVIGALVSTIANFGTITPTHIYCFQIGCLIEIILFTIAINFIYHNERINTLNLRLKNSILLNKQFEKEKENRIMKEEIEQKKRMLASKAMLISQKEDLMQYVVKELTKYKNRNTDNSHNIDDIISQLKSNVLRNSWKEFEILFSKTHPEFYKQLNEKYPGLSPNETKICTFLRLNFTTKEIANITGKSLNSIDVARYRMRKKMNLTTDTNLSTILASIG